MHLDAKVAPATGMRARSDERQGEAIGRRRIRSIVFLVESLKQPGGTERQCVELARGLAELGHRMTVLTLEGTLGLHSDLSVDRGIDLRQIGRSALGRVLSNLHPKLGQAWDMVRLGIAASRLPRGHLLVPHHYPAHWAAAVATLLSKRAVAWISNDWIYSPFPRECARRWGLRRLRRAAMIWLDGMIARRFDLVLVLSNMTRLQIETGYRIRAQVFRTGATGPPDLSTDDTARQLTRRRLGVPSDGFVVSCVCILMPHRRIEDVLGALAALDPELLHSTYFLHAGGAVDQAEQSALQHRASVLGLSDRVRFLGPVPEKERIQLLRASSVFVFPVERQSWGLAPLEALANGVPTIISTASGVAEVLHAGLHVDCYEPGDVETLAAHLRAMHRHPERGVRLAVAGRRRWEKRFTWTRAARRFERQLMRLRDLGH